MLTRMAHLGWPRQQQLWRKLPCYFIRSYLADTVGSANASASGNAERLNKGQTYSMERCFSAQDVEAYAQLCGDTNPIHRQVSAAAAAGFEEGCLVHGMLYAGLFPAIIGSKFPGAVYVSQTLEFCNPVFVGESVVAQVEVAETRKLRRHYKVSFATTCHKGIALVLKGSAVALVPVEVV